MSALLRRATITTTCQLKTSCVQLLAMRLLSISNSRLSVVEANPTTDHYDIIISGGGLVGTTLACALSKPRALADKRILLLEGAPPFKGFQGGQYANRVSAINNASAELFKTIGAWEHMLMQRVKPVKQMQVWDACSDAMIQFQQEYFSDDVAFIVENDLIMDAVYKQLQQADIKNVEIRTQSRIDAVKLPCDTETEHCEVRLQNGDTFSCDLLIGADGASSLVRQQMAVDVYSINYDRMGLVATLELDKESSGDNAVAWQRFIPSGPVAMLPLNDSMSSLVWSTSEPHAKQLADMPEAEFVEALNEAFCKEYAKSDIVVNALRGLNSLMGREAGYGRQYPPKVNGVVENSRACFPLGFLHASSYVCAGAALIGDAAHRVHPLAGQGVNLGFSDVCHLVEVLSDAAYAGAKLGDKQYLMKYEQKCLTKNVPIMIGIHGLQKLYSTTFSPVVLLRSLGLQFTQNVPQIKNIFMKQAMG